MNIKQQLTTKQEISKIENGLAIYNSNLVEQLNVREYMVKGKYIVEDLTTKDDIEPYFKCSCPDHIYRGVECKHILSVTFYQLSIRNGAWKMEDYDIDREDLRKMDNNELKEFIQSRLIKQIELEHQLHEINSTIWTNNRLIDESKKEIDSRMTFGKWNGA